MVDIEFLILVPYEISDLLNLESYFQIFVPYTYLCCVFLLFSWHSLHFSLVKISFFAFSCSSNYFYHVDIIKFSMLLSFLGQILLLFLLLVKLLRLDSPPIMLGVFVAYCIVLVSFIRILTKMLLVVIKYKLCCMYLCSCLFHIYMCCTSYMDLL